MAIVLTPNLGLPFPDNDENVDTAADIEALARAVDNLGIGVPVGALAMWPTSVAPQFWLLCDGAQVPNGTYPKLAAVLGSTDGLITLPDLKGRTPLGVSGSHPAGQTGGAETVTLGLPQIPTHDHGALTGTDSPDHAHIYGNPAATFGTGGIPGTSGGGFVGLQQWSGGASVRHKHSIAAQGGGGAHENLPPFLAVNFIIRAA